MTPELAYFLKINVAIALFYAFYRLFFHKDTFFHWRRMALLCFFAISLLYPLLNIQGWIKAHEPMVARAVKRTGSRCVGWSIRSLDTLRQRSREHPLAQS